MSNALLGLRLAFENHNRRYLRRLLRCGHHDQDYNPRVRRWRPFKYETLKGNFHMICFGLIFWVYPTPSGIDNLEEE